MTDLNVIENNDVQSLMPLTTDGKLKMAEVLCKSGLIPQGLNTPEKVFVALEWGHELNLSPMVAVNNVAVVNGKPTLSADIMNAIARKSPEYGGLKWVRQDSEVAECIVTRKTSSYTEEVRGYYDMKMASAAGLTTKDNWKKYPSRMLKHRALSFALRDAFPDVLAGIYSPDELDSENFQSQTITAPLHEELKDVTPKDTHSEKPLYRYTKEETEIIGSLMNTQKDGVSVFNDLEKETIRSIYGRVKADELISNIKNQLEAKKQG